jgi:hypothetical protein
MFACFDPFNVSQLGCLSCGPNRRSKPTSAAISTYAVRANPLASAANAAYKLTPHSMGHYTYMAGDMMSGAYALQSVFPGQSCHPH